jgi:hypothetical protein
MRESEDPEMVSPSGLPWAAARRGLVAAGIVLIVLAGVLVALLVTRTPSAAEPTPVQHTSTVEDHCTGISRDKPC